MISEDTYSFYQLVIRKHACRMRYILHQLNNSELDIEHLKKNLEYAALVLESAYLDERRRVCDDDDDDFGPPLDSEGVPDQVRLWLQATFTRPRANADRRHFKQVANVIKTGLMFDKFLRKSQAVPAPIPPNIQKLFKKVSNWDFDPFKLNKESSGNALKYVGFEIFNRYGFLDKFRINHQTLEAYLLALQVGYSKHGNPYHNLIHAADVTHTADWMISQTGILALLTDLECFAVIFGALIHDYEHTGHTNTFHVNTYSDKTMLYNDKSVLENHHASSCFRLLKEEDKNLLASLSKDEYRQFRNLVIEIVLATDMSTHFVQFKTIKHMLLSPNGPMDKTKALCLIIHACDISHPAKPFKLHQKWTLKLAEEFFRQGDQEAELGLPYSPLCDRSTEKNLPDSQVGFIEFIIEPTFNVCGEMMNQMIHDGEKAKSETESEIGDKIMTPKVTVPCPWMEIMPKNKEMWKEISQKQNDQK